MTLRNLLKSITGRTYNRDGFDTKDAKAWWMLGMRNIQAGKTEEAISCWERSLAANPKQPAVWFNKGRALQELKRHA